MDESNQGIQDSRGKFYPGTKTRHGKHNNKHKETKIIHTKKQK